MSSWVWIQHAYYILDAYNPCSQAASAAFYHLYCGKEQQNISPPFSSSDDDVLDAVHEQLSINVAGMHTAEEVCRYRVAKSVQLFVYTRSSSR